MSARGFAYPPEPSTHPRRRIAFFLLLLLLTGICVLMFAHMRSESLRRSDAYRSTQDALQTNDRLTRRIGSPIRDGLWVRGEVDPPGDGQTARLRFTVTGPHGDAVIEAQTEEKQGRWTPTALKALFDDEDVQRDLLAERTPGAGTRTTVPPPLPPEPEKKNGQAGGGPADFSWVDYEAGNYIRFIRTGRSAAVVKDMDRVAGAGDVRAAVKVQSGGAVWTCLLIDGKERRFWTSDGWSGNEFSGLIDSGFQPQVSDEGKLISTYFAITKKAQEYRAERGDRIAFLICPKKEWAQWLTYWPDVTPVPPKGPWKREDLSDEPRFKKYWFEEDYSE